MTPFEMTPEEQEFHEKIIKPYAWQVAQMRGLVIQEIVLMERMMDAYISTYFCHPDKRGEFMDLLISTKRITYEAKVHIVREILNRVQPRKKDEHTKFYKDLIFIAEERNMVAHYMSDASLDVIEKFLEDKETVALIKFEKNMTRETFTKDRVTALINKVHLATEKFIEYNRLAPSVPPQGPPRKNVDEG